MEWLYQEQFIDYHIALKAMQERIAQIKCREKPELVWCLQHPSLFTAGTSAQTEELLNDFGLPVYATGRGGRFTYHGPGQLVVYVMIDLIQRRLDIKEFLNTLEGWGIRVLEAMGIKSEQRSGRTGLWVVNEQGHEEKIVAMGVRVSRGITWHGMAINVSPQMEYFKGIIPCGLSGFGVTSLEQKGVCLS